MAEQLISNLVQPFNASKYTDDYRDNLMRIINAKLKGEKIEVEQPDAKGTEVTDLLERLQESLAKAKSTAKERVATGETRAGTRAHSRTRSRKSA